MATREFATGDGIELRPSPATVDRRWLPNFAFVWGLWKQLRSSPATVGRRWATTRASRSPRSRCDPRRPQWAGAGAVCHAGRRRGVVAIIRVSRHRTGTATGLRSASDRAAADRGHLRRRRGGRRRRPRRRTRHGAGRRPPVGSRDPHSPAPSTHLPVRSTPRSPCTRWAATGPRRPDCLPCCYPPSMAFPSIKPASSKACAAVPAVCRSRCGWLWSPASARCGQHRADPQASPAVTGSPGALCSAGYVTANSAPGTPRPTNGSPPRSNRPTSRRSPP